MIASHIGTDSVSRARRALSRAAARENAIEETDVGLHASSESTIETSTAVSDSSSSPMIESSPRHVGPSSTVASSSSSWVWTSRMRAVSSARSM